MVMAHTYYPQTILTHQANSIGLLFMFIDSSFVGFKIRTQAPRREENNSKIVGQMVEWKAAQTVSHLASQKAEHRFAKMAKNRVC